MHKLVAYDTSRNLASNYGRGPVHEVRLGATYIFDKGDEAEEFIKILVDEINAVPVIVDAGIGAPSQAAHAMEIGCDAVLVNTAVATAGNPPALARGFSLAIEAGRLAYLSNMPLMQNRARPSSPLTNFLYEQ